MCGGCAAFDDRLEALAVLAEPVGDFVPFMRDLSLGGEECLRDDIAPWGGLSEPSGPSPSACEVSGLVVDTSAMVMRGVCGIVRDVEEERCG